MKSRSNFINFLENEGLVNQFIKQRTYELRMSFTPKLKMFRISRTDIAAHKFSFKNLALIVLNVLKGVDFP